IRLIDTGNKRERYACLSHCWGGQYPLRTTKKPDTLSDHLENIEEQDLPKTFRDAIKVIVELGIRFIWIDSLCIVQDDDKDWQVQSAQMASIYANSTLTIAASASSGPHEGLFRVAAPDLIGWSISNFPDIRARKPLQHDSERLPLLERGWVFQERLLSPRVLHFTDHELIWECMEHLDCECQRLENPTAHFWSVSKQLCHPDRWRLLKDDHSEITDVWMRLIMDYFQLALSKPDDIFPAISGIAKSFGEATGWDYFAGMWKQTMI
ncbi:heterokaryon incompatibility protein-domain-containing protein, partial [Alternaria rosae]|uniref:heterokaryon incompatibility protein-domain-containing protein n=1 Tax=Alternaria rosae TaxID=1187941 RepID=UPI001E8E96E2